MAKLANAATHQDPGCDKADARESKSKTPHIQPKLSISTDSLCSQQGKTGHGHDCAKHIAPRRRRGALSRARAFKPSENHDKRNECNCVRGEPREPRQPPLRASWLKSQIEAAGKIGHEDDKHRGCQVPN